MTHTAHRDHPQIAGLGLAPDREVVPEQHGVDRPRAHRIHCDVVGTEFGGRHELYERNYAGNHEDIRIHAMLNAKGSGAYDRMIALADQCMADYDEDGWVNEAWLNPGTGSPAR